MAQSAAIDGRPLVVLYFSDCDPSGWQMPISLARKLQALKVIEFDQLDLQVHRVALLPDQVREYGLPSTPLKDTEKRADSWRDATGVAQTEIDALASLQPTLLREIADTAIAPFFDFILDERVRQARQQWLDEAQARIDEQSPDRLEQLRLDAVDAVERKADELRAILDDVRVDTSEFDLPDAVIPEAVLDDGLIPDTALCDSRWDFSEQCQRLIDLKNYSASQIGGDR